MVPIRLNRKTITCTEFPSSDQQIMNSKKSSIRVLGQRSIPSTFISRSSNKSSDFKEDVQNKTPSNGLRISLSDFLNRKLQKTSGPPKSIKGKERPFSFPGSNADLLASTEGQNGDKKNGNAELSCVLDVVLEQFKHTSKEKQDCIHSNADGVVAGSGHEVVKIKDPTSSSVGGAIGSSRSVQIQDSRKRRNPFQFQGRIDKQFARKRLLVLGSNPTPSRQGKQQHRSSNENAPPIFNHYANGCGWWDSNMEGVDNDEVGHNEVWEGVGTTTLGGLDWH